MLRRLVLACAALVFTASCAAGPPASSAATFNASISPARVDLRVVRAEPGFSEHELPVAGQGSRSIAMWLPQAEPELIVLFLHGAASRSHATWSAAAQTRGLLRCLVVPALGAQRPVVVAPRSDQGEWWRPAEAAFVLGLVEAAEQRWPRAKGRVVISGYSNGGIGAWGFARLYPEYFAAAVPMAFNDTIVGPSPLPIYAIEGGADELFSSERVRERCAALARSGQDLIYHEKYRGRHLAPCSYVPELKSAGRWLERHVLARALVRSP